MAFRRQHNVDDDEDEETVNFSPPLIRESAFSKPLLSSSSSLLPGRGAAAGGGGGAHNGAGPAGFDLRSGSARRVSLEPSRPTGDRASHQPAVSSGELPAVKYWDCLRNHAASLGSHVLDGCCEFMLGTTDAMKCRACGCHRSFHRREAEEKPFSFSHHKHSGGAGCAGERTPLVLSAPHPAAQQKYIHSFPASPPPAILAFGNSSGGTTTESSSEELGRTAAGIAHRPLASALLKKRFRSKFTAEQKVKMLEFAERIGWRIHRQDEGEMERFCSEVGVSRQVFKVWMHNNKNTITKHRRQEHHCQHP